MKCASFLLALCFFQTDFLGGEAAESAHYKAFKKFESSDSGLKNDYKKSGYAISKNKWTKEKTDDILARCAQKEHDKEDWKQKYAAAMKSAETGFRDNIADADTRADSIVVYFAVHTNKPSYDQALVCFQNCVDPLLKCDIL